MIARDPGVCWSDTTIQARPRSRLAVPRSERASAACHRPLPAWRHGEAEQTACTVAQCREPDGRRRGQGMAIGEVTPGTPAVVVPATPETPVANVAPAEEQVTLQTRRGRVLLTGFTAAHFSHHVSNSLLN